ncbi:LptF/LptG family permease [Oceanibacterium hippocampi]|uniref:Putative permease YjgP/YjgQ family protein n=1 Tax=Oceanibacterium hippocampi TaxID=745714 RepID=A0A1Y5U3C8_9PROT|nr:LptF/LptG family permease [Oceanibacterium hippocampi]SLN76204.1 putative permease YjgP/YjgQ family protein [Oceanibacterium hippocampi]
MTTFARYLSIVMLVRFAFLMAGGVMLALSFDLMERADNVLAREGGGIPALAGYALLRLPDIAADLMPIASLLATALAFGELMRHRELVALWNTGLSNFGVVRSLWPAAALLVLFSVTLDNVAVPYAADGLRDRGLGPYRDISSNNPNDVVWVHHGDLIFRFPATASAEGIANPFSIFRRAADGILVERIDVQRAHPTRTGWQFEDVTRYPVESSRAIRHDREEWNAELPLENIGLLAREPRELSLPLLYKLKNDDTQGTLARQRLASWFHHRLAGIVKPILIILLVVALAHDGRLAASFTRLLIATIAFGFGYMMLERWALATGAVGFLPPWLSAWGPPIALFSLAATLLFRREPAATGVGAERQRRHPL